MKIFKNYLMNEVGIIAMFLLMATLVGGALSLKDGYDGPYTDQDRVVRIDYGNARGSGVVISRDGLIVTNAHVVSDQRTVKVTFRNGKVVIGKVLWTGRQIEGDLALVSVPKGDYLHPVRLDCDYEPRIGDELKVIGHPFGRLFWTTTHGFIAGRYKHYVTMDLSIAPGSSGGAVIHKGYLVGIVTAGWTTTLGLARIPTGFNFMTDVKTLCRFLSR